MDIVIGIIFWGGLLWLTLAWLTREGRSEPPRRTPSTGPSLGRPGARAVAPTPPAAPLLPADEQQQRVDDALVDGLVIGHFLTRDRYERRIGELEDPIDGLGRERDPWLGGVVGDDLEQGTGDAEFDAMGGSGVEPWADDLFDMDDMGDMDDED